MSKLLAHFLQEQQEPFALEAFLLERGCRRDGIKKSPNCSAFLKAVFGRNTINLKVRHGYRCSSVSRTNSDTQTQCLEANAGEGEVGGERKKKRRGDEELSPVSVLDETESDQDYSPIHCKLLHKHPQEKGESSNSISQFKLKKHSFQVGPNTCDQYSVNMRVLQQRKQLLIDCVREVVERREKEELKKILLGDDEAWKLVCKNVEIWSKDSINGSNILYLLHSDFLDSKDEWSADFEQKKMEISIEVESAIFEDVIDEIVTF